MEASCPDLAIARELRPAMVAMLTEWHMSRTRIVWTSSHFPIGRLGDHRIELASPDGSAADKVAKCD